LALTVKGYFRTKQRPKSYSKNDSSIIGFLADPSNWKWYIGPEIIESCNVSSFKLKWCSAIGANKISISSDSYFLTVPFSGVIVMKFTWELFLKVKSKLKSPQFSIVIFRIFFSLTNIFPKFIEYFSRWLNGYR